MARSGDLNANVIFETLTDYETRHAMAQRYIPEARQGDKRILLVNGAAADHVLARVPAKDDHRGNLVMGAAPELRPLTERDRWVEVSGSHELFQFRARFNLRQMRVGNETAL